MTSTSAASEDTDCANESRQPRSPLSVPFRSLLGRMKSKSFSSGSASSRQRDGQQPQDDECKEEYYATASIGIVRALHLTVEPPQNRSSSSCGSGFSSSEEDCGGEEASLSVIHVKQLPKSLGGKLRVEETPQEQQQETPDAHRSGLFRVLRTSSLDHDAEPSPRVPRPRSVPDLAKRSPSRSVLEDMRCTEPGEFRKCRHCQSVFPFLRVAADPVDESGREALRHSFCSGECHLTFVTLYHLESSRRRQRADRRQLHWTDGNRVIYARPDEEEDH